MAYKDKEKKRAWDRAHPRDRTAYRHQNPVVQLLASAKWRSKKRGIEFTITHSDVIVPDVCPVLGIPVFITGGQPAPNSPSIDRIDPTGGYTPNNIWVISWRANLLKNNARLEDFEKIVAAIEPIIQQGGIWYPSTPYVKSGYGVGPSQQSAILSGAKKSAKKYGRECSIEHSDIVIPNVCPILGIPLFVAGRKQTDNSPTLDRIDSSMGYVKGNVWVISWRANRIKKDGTLEEFKALVKAWHAKLEEMRLLKTG